MKLHRLSNDLWEVDIAPEHDGRVVRLVDRATGATRVNSPALAAGEVAEGGHAPFLGLDCWVKCGDIPDPNTGVLSTFAPIHHQPLTAEPLADGIRLLSEHAGLRLTLEWRLPSGAAPLSARLNLESRSAATDTFQIECFFIWSIPDADWSRTAVHVPGLAPIALPPYGQIVFKAGDTAAAPAAWWTRGTGQGVALRAVAGVERFCFGDQSRMFILSPYGHARRLSPGESMSAEFEIAPLAWASRQGWPCGVTAAEEELKKADARMEAAVRQVGSVSGWVHPPTPAPIARRALHLTLQYKPADADHVIRLLEEVVAPAGYTELMVEVDRAFPYRSHPKVAAPWSWTRGQWKRVIAAARGLGLAVTPQYNALAHQGESALATAYPELREDDGGWCLCPREPRVRQYLCELFDELLDAFAPQAFHIGLDEVDVPSRPQTFCVCPKCRGADGGALFAEHILGLHAHLRSRRQEVIMWADMLLHQPEHNTVNGLRTGMWRAIDRLPRDILMIDWVYSPVKAYGGTEYLLRHGFPVMGATWHTPAAIVEFSRYAAERRLAGMCQTMWSSQSFRDMPLACVLLAGKCFAHPAGLDTDGTQFESQALARSLEGHL